MAVRKKQTEAKTPEVPAFTNDMRCCVQYGVCAVSQKRSSNPDSQYRPARSV